MATEVLVPPLGQTVDTVTLVSWYKKEGQTVARGEILFAIETDKATLDIEAPASGVLRRVTAAPGDEVRVLSAIALITAPDEVLAETPAILDTEPVRRQAKAALSTGQGAGDDQQQQRRERILISPRARRLAEKQGIQWAALEPTGPEGAIIERDVRAYLEAKRKGDKVGLEVAQTIPATGIRAVIADRMSQSASRTASVTLNAEADATALVDMRHCLGQDGLDVSYNDLLLYVLGRALREHPRLNASLEGDTIKLWQQIHIGLAIDTDWGLLVPVVRDADRKPLGQLASETRTLIERAKAGQCSTHELSGGTFTLTNLGMLGIDSFTPIINLPECGILSAGRIKARPAMVNDRIVARQMMWLSLTFDHRLVDGALAARFLQRVVHLIEQPYLLLI
jgi:pyruvate dehydrogenase E2 component (dihydrolipoamide acetyltransferase)